MMISTRILTLLLSVGLLWQSLPTGAFAAADTSEVKLAELQARYPNARVCRVTEEQFRSIEPHLRKGVGDTYLLAQTNICPMVVLADYSERPNGGDGKKHKKPKNLGSGSVRMNAGIFDFLGDLGGVDGDAAIVIFVVVGVLVVAAVVVYSGVFLYRALTGVGDYSYWWDAELHSSTLVGGGDSGFAAALRLSSGVDLDEARLGMVVEGGYLSATITLKDAPNSVAVEGGYVMGGAGVRWPVGGMPENRSFFGVEMLAGNVWDTDVDLMSVARTTLSLGIGAHTRLGFSLGALYLGLDTDDSSLVEEGNNFTSMLGVEVGVRF